MKRVDRRTEEEIRTALEYAVEEIRSSGKPIYASTRKFREKFETLYIQARSNRTAAETSKEERLRRWADNE